MKDKKVLVLGIETHYIETDGLDATPLIILHGWGSSSKSWINVARFLESSGKHVFVPDLPGFGKTPEPKKPWGVADYVKFVEKFAEILGIKKFSLAGHSFGGQIAIAFAAKNSSNLHALILMSAARIAKRRKLKTKIFGTLTTIGNLIFLIYPLRFLKPVVQKIWYALSGEQDYYRASDLMKETMKLVIGEEMRPKLDAIKMPTLILWGESDYVTPLEDGRIIQSRIAGSKLQIFSGAGHDINIKQPENIAREINKFIK